MKKIHDWERLRREVEKLQQPDTLELFERYLREEKLIHAIKLLREKGIQIEE